MNDLKPPLAILTVTFSPGEHLGNFLSSAADATERDIRVVLADNGSTDGAPEAAAQKHEHVEFLATGGNVGYGSGMNAAARHLAAARERGEIDQEFFLISNPDVVFLPGSVDVLLQRAAARPHAAAVGPRIVEPDGSTYPSARALPTLANGIGHALFATIWPNNPWTASYRADHSMDVERRADWLSGSCLLVRWEAFEAIGGFDERYFMYMEDVDLGDRFARAGYDNIYCPAAVITHAQGHSTSSHASTMLPAHHASAFRFQADRLTKPWQVPVRWALWWGLKLRSLIAVGSARSKN